MRIQDISIPHQDQEGIDSLLGYVSNAMHCSISYRLEQHMSVQDGQTQKGTLKVSGTIMIHPLYIVHLKGMPEDYQEGKVDRLRLTVSEKSEKYNELTTIINQYFEDS